ncbi:MAG TPA: hypothetical protein VMT19_08225 [Thermoanaerobaculaceae bacterium]|nr:hypothetical protein [Thermoanaerobaculaceae bacterium]
MTTGKAPLWVRAGRVYREKGASGVWFGALSLVGYRRLVLLAVRLDAPAPVWQARVDAEIRPLLPADEAAFEALGQGDARVFRERLALGHQPWGAWSAGALRHVVWVGVGSAWVEYLRCQVSLGVGVAYAYRAYTEPPYRGLGLGPATQSACLAALRADGFVASLAGVLPDNPWAFAPWLKVGYARIGVVRAFGAGRRPLVAATFRRGAGLRTGFRFERALRGAPA